MVVLKEPNITHLEHLKFPLLGCDVQVPPGTEADLIADVDMPKKLEPGLQPTQAQRPKMNARERWHWAYNRVVHQINVSTRPLSVVVVDPSLLDGEKRHPSSMIPTEVRHFFH